MERADNEDIEQTTEDFDSKEKYFENDENNPQELALDETTLNVNVTFSDIGHNNILKTDHQKSAEKPTEDNTHNEPDQSDNSANDNNKPKLARLVVEGNTSLGEQPDQQKRVYR
jgi:hypothetical protein